MSRSNIPRFLPPLQQKKGEGDGLAQQDSAIEKRVDFANSNHEPFERDEDEQEVLQPAPNHDSGMMYSNYMNDDIIYNCFGFGDRFNARMSRLLHCEPNRLTHVDKLLKVEDQQIQASLQLSAKDQQLIGPDRIVTIVVLSTSQLQMDTNIQHPFVRIHVINMKTGCYISKPGVEDRSRREYSNAVYNYETNCITNIIDGERERVTCELELLTAFSTNFCDMRMATNSRASWNEEILINVPADQFFNRDTVILFELLDFHPIYLQQRNEAMLDSDNFYRIAWGYIRPNGLCKLHIGLSKIQLYKYLFDTKQLKSVSRRESIPLVYFDFLWLDKQEYDAVLNVQVLTEQKLQFLDIWGKNQSTNVFEIERGDEEIKQKVKQKEQIEQVIEQKVEELTEQEKINLRRRRYLGDKEDHIPEKIAYKFASAPLGCYRLVFNKNGNFLACACTYKNSKTIIKIFDVENGSHFATYKGHRNIIHALQFSNNTQYLITSSSDYTTKIWWIPQVSGEIISEDESDLLLYCTYQHPSFVYDGIFLMDGNLPVSVTACFDSRLRVWQPDNDQGLQIIEEAKQQEIISYDGMTFDQFENLNNHRHPNCIVYDGAKCLYVGDSLGNIHFYDINLSGSVDIISRLGLIVIQELQKIPINSLQLMPPEYQDLLVHSRDNCIRIIDYKSAENKFHDSETIQGSINNRFFGSLCNKIACKSVPSPKGDYIIAGSEDGKPHLWSNLGQTLPTDIFQFNVIGPIADVAWNQGYHMVALAGFGDEHPIIVYVWERQGDLNFIEAKKLQDEVQIKHREPEDIMFTVQNKVPQNRFQLNLQAQGLFQPQYYVQEQAKANTGGPFGQSQQSNVKSQFPQQNQSVPFPQPNNIPPAQSSMGGPFGQQPTGGPFGQQPAGGPFGQSGVGPFGSQPGGGPFGQQQPSGGPFGQQQPSGGPFGSQQPSGGPFGQQPPNGGPFGQLPPNASSYIQQSNVPFASNGPFPQNNLPFPGGSNVQPNGPFNAPNTPFNQGQANNKPF